MKKLLALLISPIFFFSCSSTKLVDEYINTENPNFHPKKVLVIGLTPDGGLQRQFEFSLVNALKAENVNAVKSVDYFEAHVATIDQAEGNLANLENELLKTGFDAVIFSKVIGQEHKVTLAQSYRNLSKSFQTFSDYYNENKIISGKENTEDYPVYNTETSLYCLCPNQKQDLIWRGNIDIVNPSGSETTIMDYVETLLKRFKKNKILGKN
ncbi:hypothetical protein [Aequorivita marina]|uniref:hypothetical protein n=1 Tax=Aequorivita marina TaxID=3073654 RepID=UPI002876161D|nr:hypothetical protein [Aequorivita sp. S2608]MDS1298679.1 hypothetical protein [Aequorivita sp. S2608]